jgi:hypothetical protein
MYQRPSTSSPALTFLSLERAYPKKQPQARTANKPYYILEPNSTAEDKKKRTICLE